MQTLFWVALTLGAGLAGFAGTLAVHRAAPRLGLVQAPNERSSHVNPTPRGGGIAIASAIVAAATLLVIFGFTGLWPVAVLTLAIAILGFGDDLWDLSPALRFPVQGIVLSLLVWSAAPLAPLVLVPGVVVSGWVLAVGVVIVGLWWINLFNFMDGIDGIAASHAIMVLAGAGAIWVMSGVSTAQQPLMLLLLCSIAATAGFLVHNWPPARIFMGDAGSNSLALVIFAIALYTSASGAIGYPAWMILPATFVADATVTVIRRTARGERPWRAHRRHAYQQLSRRWGHRPVTLLYSAITALWCIPLAVASQLVSAYGWLLVGLAYAPILAMAIRAEAGAAHENRATRTA